MAEMAGAEDPGFMDQDDAVEVLNKVDRQQIMAHAPVPRFLHPSLQGKEVKMTLVLAIDVLKDAALAGWGARELELIAGKPLPAGFSINTVSLPVWSPADSDAVASSVLNERSARFFDMETVNSNKTILKGVDQHAAREFYLQHVASGKVQNLLDTCLVKIGADAEVVTIRPHLLFATNRHEFAHGIHFDPIATTTRFVVAKEMIVSAGKVAEFKTAVMAAKNKVHNFLVADFE